VKKKPYRKNQMLLFKRNNCRLHW